MMKYFDISPVVDSQTAVFPGDTPFERDVSMSFQSGQHLELSSVKTTVHIGAHADAASHYHRDGESIEKRDLNLYMGMAQVIRLKLKPKERILPFHIRSHKIQAPRVLFCTSSYLDPQTWNSHFNSLSPELIEDLATQGVVLVGIDTPSVDPADSKNLETHQAIYRAKMAILEGLVLQDVPTGLYQLIALPLPLRGLDASPVRAVLLPSSSELSRN